MTGYTDIPWVLASASPRRLALLRQAGVEPQVIAADVEELEDGDPAETVLENARRKNAAVRGQVDRGIVLAADTEVVVEGRPIGKPQDEAEAMRMLTRLADSWHEVMTGYVIACRMVAGENENWTLFEGVEKTRVHFRPLHSSEIEQYIQMCKPLDKAGAYGIQEQAGMFVDRLEGCYFNVVGLPLAGVFQEVRKWLNNSDLG